MHQLQPGLPDQGRKREAAVARVMPRPHPQAPPLLAPPQGSKQTSSMACYAAARSIIPNEKDIGPLAVCHPFAASLARS
eukprot:38911-Chlamydomonas_euryale.AAC.9